MNHPRNSALRRGGALTLSLALTASLIAPAAAQEGAVIPSAHDETYYATLDYYGGILDSSVVKSYKTYGNDTITDYGVYDEVINLTDDLEPTIGDGSLTFQLGETAPKRFYFEGKTKKPMEEFPWTLSISYTLNGVPTLGEDLAGKEGLVEIKLDAVPNPASSEYSRNNLVLTAMSAFNGDDILSLEAEGAQVQMVGNLYSVLFMVMPGEEQHFTIRVGAEDFSYGGMIFLAVPATLQQLDQIKDLREAKEKTEASYHALQDSMDVILNTLEGMSGSLSTTANGLDQLNQARDTFSNGKGQVYDSLDVALEAAGPLTESLKPAVEHLTVAQQALTDTTQLLNEINGNVTSLKPEVENCRKILEDLQDNLDDLRSLSSDLEDYTDRVHNIARDLAGDFTNLGSSMSDLEDQMKTMRNQLSRINSSLADVSGTNEVTIDLNGRTMTVGEIKSAVRQAEGAYEQYQGALAGGQLPPETGFQDFLVIAAGKSPEEAAQIEALLSYSQSSEFQQQIETAEELNALLKQLNMTVGQLKTLVRTLNDKGGPVLSQLENLCHTLNNSNLSGDLRRLSDMMADLATDLDDHKGTLSSLSGTLKSAAALGVRVSENLDTALDQAQALNDLVNTYEPETQQALEDAKTFTDSATTSISALVDAAKTTEELAKQSGTNLDAGTKQALNGLSAALRQSTKGLKQTKVIRNAKNTIDALITDEWNSHTGEKNNMLLMDASAPVVSLTDTRNEGTCSIQYVMRSQEIQVEEPEEEAPTAQTKGAEGTIWTRIADMFRDFWNTITGWFRH